MTGLVAVLVWLKGGVLGARAVTTLKEGGERTEGAKVS